MNQLDTLLAADFVNPATMWGAIVYALLFLIVAALIARALRLGVRHILNRDRRNLIDRTTANFLTELAQFFIYILAFIFYAHLIPALNSLGTVLLTGVSVLTIIFGLAAQNTLGNLIAGISLLLYRPFHVGDRIQINAPNGLIEAGVVESLTLGYTVLQTFDNRRVVIPNNVMIGQVTVNLTTKDPRLMTSVPISIGYAADIEQARQIMLELAQAHPLVEEVVSCPVTQLGSSSVTLTLRAWCANPAAAKQVEFELYEQIKNRFDQENVEIPFPYTNVVLKERS